MTTTLSTRPAPWPEMMSTQDVGRYGERIATRYLKDLGWEVLERNWRSSPPLRGELDLVAAQPDDDGGPPVLVAVEVKTRTTLTAGPPGAAVGRFKRRRLARLIQSWAAAHPGSTYRCLRIDVVSVLLRASQPAQVRHHRGIDPWGTA